MRGRQRTFTIDSGRAINARWLHLATRNPCGELDAPLTLCHCDVSLRNVVTSASGEVALVAWEDVRSTAGVSDLAGQLVSSVKPIRWDEVIDAYGPARELTPA